MNIVSTDCGDNIRLMVDGRIDSMTSVQLQSAILDAFQKRSNVVVDFLNVTYISSAGLRALLIGHKTATSKGGYMKLTNVAPSVREVLKMTGFEALLMVE